MRVLCVEHAVDHDRRGAQVRVGPAGRETPAISLSFTAGRRHAMRRLLDVVTIDLIERRVSGEPLVAAEVAPFGPWRGRLRGERTAMVAAALRLETAAVNRLAYDMAASLEPKETTRNVPRARRVHARGRRYRVSPSSLR